MTAPRSSTITVPNDLSYLSAIHAFASALAGTVGFPAGDVHKILLALEEAVVNVIEHAFDPSEAASFQIIFEPSSVDLKIIIKDKGLPFVAEEIPEYEVPEGLEEMPAKGLGSFLMKKSVDEVVFVNLGREGKELHLIKYLPFTSIVDLNKESELERYPAPEENSPSREIGEYEIRLMRPEECPEVSRLFYRAYGYSYGIDSIYYPDKFAQLHRDGLIVSVVTVTKENGIVGHLALVRNDAEERTAEAAMAVVQPDFRGQGFQNLMISTLGDEARKIGLLGIYSKAVTNHIFAQKAGIKAGFKRCAIAVGLIPADRSFKGIRAELSQRESVAFGFLPLTDPAGIVLYPPAQHRQFVQKIFTYIGLSRSFGNGIGAAAKEETSSIKTTVVPSYNRAVIEIHAYGKDTVSEIKKTLKELRFKKTEEITLYLSLEDPLTAVFCEAFEEMGFFIAGVLPFSHVGDALILQYLNNVLIDYSRIQVFSEPAEEILSYVKDHDPNIR
jgi:anti-sigma regulatory factor (Ser/Thr protein kinase)